MRTLATLIALAATPAIACPTADDLATGIRVTEPDDLQSIFKSVGPDLVEVTIEFDVNDVSRNQLVHGVYIRRLSSIYEGSLDFESVWLTDYSQDIASLPLPVPGLEQSFKTTIYSFTESYPETQAQSWGPLEEVTYGDCTTPVINGTIVYDNKYGPVTETIAYLPDMGIGLLTSYADGDEEPEIYEIVQIEAVE